MKLTMKHFKKDQRVDVCDEFGNLIQRMHYEDPTIDIGTIIRANTYVRAYCDGWVAARNSISNCEAGDRMVDVDADNERNWGAKS
jgi:hypothetical protein